MELTPRQFAEMVAHLKGPSRYGGSQEQRRAPRVDRQARLTITPVAGARPRTPIAVEVKNLSARGLGFVHGRQLPPGSQFLVHLPQQGGEPAEVLCTVAHCTAAGDGVFSVGAEFTRLATAAPAAASMSS